MTPLTPAAVAGRGLVGEMLARRAARRQASSAALGVTRVGEWIVVQGDGDALPWADGCVLLGNLPGATGVLVPVHRVPSVPADIVELAVRRLAAPSAPPVLLLPDETGSSVTVLAVGPEGS